MSKDIAPRYHGYSRYYNDFYAGVVKCSSCECVALYEDMPPVNPCFLCGGEVEELKEAARWHEASGRWVFAGEEYPQEEEKEEEAEDLGETFAGELLIPLCTFIVGILAGVFIF